MSTSSEQTRSAVEAMLAAISSGDGEALMACLDEELVFTMPGSTSIHGVFRGHEGFSAASAAVMDRLATPIELSVENIIIAGEWAAVEARGKSTTKKGAPYNNHYCFIWRVRDGKVCEMTEYHDTDLVRRVLLA